MRLEYLQDLAGLPLFLAVAFFLAWPVATRLSLPAVEKIAASLLLSLLGIFLVAWTAYVLKLPFAICWTLPLLTLAGIALNARSWAGALRDEEVQPLIVAQLLVTVWCLGWLALIVSYSGGGWAADWIEHWERTRFFLERWPKDHLFLGRYPLTARPPLANVVTAVFLRLTRADFAHYQVASTLLGSLVFLPAALLARRFGEGYRTTAVLAVLVMLNPLFVQNATFAWTKLPAAFFVLTALYFFLRTQEGDAPRAAAPLFTASLAGGLLTHYSSGPYAVVLALAWLACGWKRRRDPAWWRSTAATACVGALVLAAWFGWALAAYGVHGTLFSNSSITALEAEQGSQLAKIALNLRDTLIPHFLRPLDETLIAQTSPWGRWRDWWFQLYQLNLFFALGSVAWLAILVTLARDSRRAEVRRRLFWPAFVAGVIVLGVAVHGARDTWGLTHICLQPLVVLGLAFLSGRWVSLSRPWRSLLCLGGVADFAFGIALHFGVQSFALDRWLTPGRSLVENASSYDESALMNFAAKLNNHVDFFSDALQAPLVLVLGVLAAALAFALLQASRSSHPTH